LIALENQRAKMRRMRWFRIRKANIDPELRDTFERYGTVAMQIILATGATFRHKGVVVTPDSAELPDPSHWILPSLLPWLTEQFDKAERRETWNLTMEAAITVFFLIEILPTLFGFLRGIVK
jgi:hypothetical protein